MKLLIALGRSKGPLGVPYAMVQAENDAYENEFFRKDMEARVLEAMGRDFRGTAVRLLWIEQGDHQSVPEDLVTALADGAQIPWEILQDRPMT